MTAFELLGQNNNPSRVGNGANTGVRGTRDGCVFSADYMTALAMEGRIFYASDADQNDVVTGQTSFANTTPTFLLRVPSGVTAIPLGYQLAQAGSVAGAAIDILTEIDNADRYSSGGTAETVLSTRTDAPYTNLCTLYTGATASSGYGVMVDHKFALIQDVASALTDVWEYHQPSWVPPVPMFLVGPAAWLIYTYAATTGPSWLWSIRWAEIPSNMLT